MLWRKKPLALKAHLNAQQTTGEVQLMDMAKGTADFALEAMRSGINNLRVTGVDISPGMLAIGRKKVQRKGWTDRVQLIEGDSAELPFEDGTFDAWWHSVSGTLKSYKRV